MNKTQKKYYLNCCHDIKLTTNTDCLLYESSNDDFCKDNFHKNSAFCSNCSFCDKECNWKNHMKNCASEASRWKGQYLFSCNRGLMFIAISIFNHLSECTGCIINGPFLFGNRENALCLINGNYSDITNVPEISGEKIESFINLWTALCHYNLNNNSNTITTKLNNILNNTIEYADILKKEKQLNKYICDNDLDSANNCLINLFEISCESANNTLCHMQLRSKELLNIISKSSLEAKAPLEKTLSLTEEKSLEIDSLKSKTAILSWLTSTLNEFMNTINFSHSSNHKNILISISNYVNENYTQKITLDDIACFIYLSKSHICKILKDEFNCTFIEYVNKIRVNKSCSLLEDNSIPISNIASLVGFCDQSYFTKVFKKNMGLSPKQFRLQSIL